VAQYRDILQLLGFRVRAADERLRPQNGEEVARRQPREERLRLTGAGEDALPVGPRGERLEGAALLAPTPSASVSTTAAVKPGLFLNVRAAKLMSSRRSSHHSRQRILGSPSRAVRKSSKRRDRPLDSPARK